MRIRTSFAAGVALALGLAAAVPCVRAQDKTDAATFPEGALAPHNLAKPRPKPPFDLTGTWTVDLSAGFSSFMFGPPYPKFLPDAQAAYDEAKQYAAEHKPYRDDIGHCYPAGMPM
ncbi:MAG TPA: hypothetical protein VGG64_19425, partial [Pirellulales bacterium]